MATKTKDGEGFNIFNLRMLYVAGMPDFSAMGIYQPRFNSALITCPKIQAQRAQTSNKCTGPCHCVFNPSANHKPCHDEKIEPSKLSQCQPQKQRQAQPGQQPQQLQP